jgi:ATP phosphoribosyltransferase regulatory subunit
MTEDFPAHPALLPVGMRDVLPPEAEIEALTVATLMDRFAAHGYQRVKPPVLEFEESLFAGSGAAVAEQTFRLMDPESQRMMGLRADTTPQIARIAATRLARAPRPLRLAYAGQCLRVRGSQLAPERQVAQAGIELIGADGPEADAEVILAAADALAAIGLERISVDLTMPPLAPLLLQDFEPGMRNAIARALDRKDAAAVAKLGGERTDVLLALLDAAGTAQRAVEAIGRIALPQAAAPLAERLVRTVEAVRHSAPDLPVTIDPVEFRGYRYHTGVSVTLYAPGRQEEIGRGGRYVSGENEASTGITLFPDVIQRIAPAPVLRPRLYLPWGTAPEQKAQARAAGFATVAGLGAVSDDAAEALRLDCTHILTAAGVVALNKD